MAVARGSARSTTIRTVPHPPERLQPTSPRARSRTPAPSASRPPTPCLGLRPAHGRARRPPAVITIRTPNPNPPSSLSRCCWLRSSRSRGVAAPLPSRSARPRAACGCPAVPGRSAPRLPVHAGGLDRPARGRGAALSRGARVRARRRPLCRRPVLPRRAALLARRAVSWAVGLLWLRPRAVRRRRWARGRWPGRCVRARLHARPGRALQPLRAPARRMGASRPRARGVRLRSRAPAPTSRPAGGIAVGGGYVYVSDSAANRIVRFRLDGSHPLLWGRPGSAPGRVLLAARARRRGRCGVCRRRGQPPHPGALTVRAPAVRGGHLRQRTGRVRQPVRRRRPRRRGCMRSTTTTTASSCCRARCATSKSGAGRGSFSSATSAPPPSPRRGTCTSPTPATNGSSPSAPPGRACSRSAPPAPRPGS